MWLKVWDLTFEEFGLVSRVLGGRVFKTRCLDSGSWLRSLQRLEFGVVQSVELEVSHQPTHTPNLEQPNPETLKLSSNIRNPGNSATLNLYSQSRRDLASRSTRGVLSRVIIFLVEGVSIPSTPPDPKRETLNANS